MLCQQVIWIDDKRNTYCMRETGHTGKCSVDPKHNEPIAERTNENVVQNKR